jgi:two-component SAPR family response regulator
VTPDLGQRRILIVEDEYLLAMHIANEVESHNGVVLGPVTTLEQGLLAFRDQKPDACIVNINLGPDKVYELADEMVREGVPFVFASSEMRTAIPRFRDIPLHTKPINMVEAAAALTGTNATL